jgi:hypothetical protein
MKRALIVAVLMLGPCGITAAPTEFDYNLAEFVKPFGQFIDAYTGCPVTARKVEDCVNPKYFDYKAYYEARRRAAKLFNLSMVE